MRARLTRLATDAAAALAAGDFEAAIATYRRIVELVPGFSAAHSNLGVALFNLGRLGEAEAAFRRAIATKPDSAEAYSNLGYVLQELGRNDEALAALRHAVALKADCADAQSNLGAVLQAEGRVGEAADAFGRAAAISPEHAKARSNLGQVLLRNGDYAQGWREYEWRWQAVGLAPPRFVQPEWDGGPPAGRTLLLHAEQGQGDTIQFARFIPLLAAMGARVVLAAPPPLVELLGQLPATVVAAGQPLPPFDVHLALLSLPRVLGTTADTIPAEVPYLRSPPGRVPAVESLLAPSGRLRLGITWAGNPQHANDRRRSVPSRLFAPLCALPGVQVFSLQVGRTDDAVPPAGAVDLAPHLAAGWRATAAAIANLDLCICVNSAVAHLAGAMACPVWVLLPLAADWRWLLERTDLPWYPTARLFRQQRTGGWEAVMARVAAELRRAVPGGPP